MSRVAVERFWRGDEFKAHMEKVAQAAVMAGGIEIQGEMVRRLGQAASPSPPGGPPGVDTGRLRRSITVQRTGLTVTVGTNLDYGRWLEFGANPRARKSKYMPVPITREARMAQRRVGSVRSIPGLKPLKTPRGFYLVKEIGGKRARVEFWFVLKKSVRIAPRPWLRPSLNAAMPRAEAKIREVMAQGVQSFRGAAA